MTQTRLGSFIEAWVNVLIGFSINWCANLVILPMFGFNVSPGQAFEIGLWFTAVSVARSYYVRRYFNARLHTASERLSRAIRNG